MPDRIIIPLLPAITVGFITGIIASALQLGSGGTFAVAAAGAVLVALAASSSVFTAKGETGEKAIVGVLRALCAVALMVCIFLFILGFLRDGEPVKGLVWLALAGAFAAVIAKLRVRERGDLRTAED